MMSEGVTDEQCFPYQDKTETCSYSCANPEDTYAKHSCKVGSVKVLSSLEDIQQEIYSFGSVMVSLIIYEDLYSYGGGVY